MSGHEPAIRSTPAAARRNTAGTCSQRGSRYGGGTITPMPITASLTNAFTERRADVARAVIERRHVDAGNRHVRPGGPTPRRLLAIAARDEIRRLPQARAAHQADRHRAAGAQVTAADHAERIERRRAVERAEIRDDRVEAFGMIERVEELRQILQPARQDADAIAEAGRFEAALRAAQHFLRRIAGDHAGAEPREELRVGAGAAADLQHAEPRSNPSRQQAMRLLALQLKRLAGRERVVGGRQAIECQPRGRHDSRLLDIDFTGTR